MGRFLICLLVLLSPIAGNAQTVYLTFDDGPDGGTANVLKDLKDLDIKATFFLTGSTAYPHLPVSKDEQRSLLKKIRSDGHKTGNHTLTHKPQGMQGYKDTYGATAFKDAAAEAAFKKNFTDNQSYFSNLLDPPEVVTFKVARLPGDGFRFPYLVAETKALGMAHYAWAGEYTPNGEYPSRESTNDLKRDWQGLAVASSYATNGWPKEGDVILFHDHHWGTPEKAELLKSVIKKLKDHGCTFAIVAD